MHTCNIFVSSPGDVALERALVARVIERLRKIFGHRSQLNLMLWEEQPLDASHSFQPQLPDPAKVDVFIMLLWQRMGTPLPDDAIPAPFSGPLTGSEYEFLAALEAQNMAGSPSVMVYRRMDAAGKRADAVNRFFDTHFTDDKARLSKAYHQYTTVAEFESQIETHLYRWFDSHLPKLSESELAQTRAWYSGNPFQGLKAFRFEQANVFCGRDDAIAEATEKLRHKLRCHQPFLLIMGMSGSGKSSLARAGILPALYPPADPLKLGLVLRGVMRPADIEGDPFRALVLAFAADSAGTLLAKSDINALSKMAREAPDNFVGKVSESLQSLPRSASFVLLIDQLEELFTSAAISVESQIQFTRTIARLVEELGIIVIATLRSDCYHHLTTTPELLRLKQDGGQLDLSPPALYNIRQMITIPARAAKLHFEEGEKGQPPLDEQIANSAARSPESLPLLEFTLTQLYERRTPGGMLTFAQYHALGGIEGAIASHAEAVFCSLDSTVRKRFAHVFNQLSGCDENGRCLRKWAQRHHLQSDIHADTLVRAFLKARLLVSERNPDGIEVVTLAHESLFIHWPRLVNWLDTNRNLLNIRNQMSEQAGRWQTAGNDPAMLLNAGKPLEDGKALVASELTLSPELDQFVGASVKRARRNQGVRYAAIAALVAVTLFATSASFSARQSQQAAERNLAKSQDLIEFLIGDLHTQLDKLGRLDVMQSIGEKAMNYFAQLDDEDSNDASLLNRTKALYQIGSVYMDIAQYDQATRAFRQSLEQARALTEQSPGQYDYLFEQAQAEFWLGYAYWTANRLDKAETQFLSYRDAALNLVELAPEDAGAMMEVAYANSNLGTLADSRGNIDTAIGYFLKAAEVTLRVVALSPHNLDAIATLADIYSWLGSAHEKQLRLTQALSFYRSEQQLFTQIAEQEHSYRAQINVVLANNRLAKVEVFSGHLDEAIAIYQAQQQIMENLVSHDPENKSWREILSATLAYLGEVYVLRSDLEKAQRSFASSFSVNNELPEQASSFWVSTYYHRQYWYWRMLVAQGNSEIAASAERIIETADVPAASLWRLRVASHHGKTIMALPEALLGPSGLMAKIEQALAREDWQGLSELVSITPDVVWQYPELAALRPDIQSALAQNAI